MTKKLLLVSSLIWMMVFTAFGQDTQGGRPTPEDMAKRQTEMIVKATGINAATTAKVEVINLKYAKENAALREKFPDRDARSEPRKVLNEKRDAELKTVLTAEQFTKVQEAQAEMRRNMQGGGGPR